MKRLLFALWLPALFLACSAKNDTPVPDAGAAVSGIYELRRSAKLENDTTIYDYAFPQTTATARQSGRLTISRSSATSVYVAVVLQVEQRGRVDSSITTFGKMDVKPTAAGYELSQYGVNNRKTGSGTASGSAMNIELSDTYAPTMTTTRYIIEGRR